MPNITIHEEVGFFLRDKLNVDSYDYYLGLLAPDAPNTYGFGKKEERWLAHQRAKNLNEWRNNLKEFYKYNKNNYNKDFILGYIIHILTDIIYDDYLYLKVRDKILNDNISLEESHEIMRNDMDKYYFNELEIIKEKLKEQNTTYEINGINKELMSLWKNKVLNNNISINNSKYITQDIINELNNLVLQEIKEYY